MAKRKLSKKTAALASKHPNQITAPIVALIRKLSIQTKSPKVASKRKIPTTHIAVTALVIIALALSVTTFAALTNSPQLSSVGVVTTSPSVSKSPNVLSNGAVTTSANCGLYSDSACTTPLRSIDWGNLTAGGTVTQTIYIKNTSSGLPLTLNMTTTNWSPASANGPITITWNQEGTTLSPGQSTVATLTLTVSSSEVGITDFSVQIYITGTNP